MPVTPHDAIEASPAAQLTEDEYLKLATVLREIDKALMETWPGGSAALRCATPFSARVSARIHRAYTEAGWNIVLEAMDGAFAKGTDLIAAGAESTWVVKMAPDWTRKG